MKIVVIGGTGLIGSRVVTRLRAHGHVVVGASPGTGVDTLTGEGRSDAGDDPREVVAETRFSDWLDRATTWAARP